MSTNRRTLGVYSSPTPKGPNGERLCRNCSKALEKGQRHNCSPKCSEEWMCKTSPSYLRYMLSKRDHGICAICGLNTLDLWAAIKFVNEQLRKRGRITEAEWYAFRHQVGSRWPSDLWDADHIIPVIEGGGECGLENYRTLCIPCHKRETADLAKRLAAKKRQIKRADAIAELSRPLQFGDKAQIQAKKVLKNVLLAEESR